MREYLCITCCQINKYNKKSLPVRCPKTKTFCFAINPQYVIPEIDDEFLDYVVEHNKLRDEYPEEVDIARIEMDSKFIDKEFIKVNCMCFDKLAKDGDKGVYCAEAY